MWLMKKKNGSKSSTNKTALGEEDRERIEKEMW